MFALAITNGDICSRMIGKNIDLSDYTYELPDERIAKFPVHPRDSSKLLVYNKGEIRERRFFDLPTQLPSDSMVVFNDTKVVQARFVFAKETGGKIEVFCLEPANSLTWEQALLRTTEVEMSCLVGGIGKWKKGPLKRTLNRQGNTIDLLCYYVEDLPDSKKIRLEWITEEELSFADIMNLFGDIPLPPYLNRATEANDASNYQTIYALNKGSVAAPTAGLHFTNEVMSALKAKGISKLNVTLHVGAGTFKPIKAENIQEHVMHEEWMHVRKEQLQQLITNKGKVIAIGTTSVRFIESLYWLGVKCILNQQLKLQDSILQQWECYEMPVEYSVTDAFGALLNYMQTNDLQEFHCHTQIMIVPGYSFKVIDALVTNFHQPNSTLLLLIGACVGDNWRTIYKYALENDFRFLSFGDSSLLWVNKKN